MVNWISLAFPFIYLGLLVGALSTFSSLYRNRKAQRARSLAPWFEAHPSRDVYFSLLHQADEDDINNERDGKEPKVSSSSDPKVSPSLLKAALLRRAMADVQRVVEIRNAKPALAQLLQRGSIGDDLWARFLRAEQEMEEELQDVITEANGYREGWGTYIFQSGNEMAQNIAIKKRIESIQGDLASEQQWWEKQRASMSEELMNELETENKTKQSVNANGPASSSKTGKTSDDEAVLVEAGGPTDSTNKKNKKKSKK